MKKLILTVLVSGSFIMCKKGEASSPLVENVLSTADSTVTDVHEKINSAHDAAKAVFDSADIKIKDFEKAKSEAEEKIEATAKTIDSIAEKISGLKLESKLSKNDSVSKKMMVNDPAPKVIKETKIIYKDKPIFRKPVVRNKMMKNGVLDLIVDNTETAKEIVKEEIRKYDGIVNSENISLNNSNTKTAYLRMKVPIQKFDDLMDELSYNIGEVTNKGISVTGTELVNNTMCDVEITICEASQKSIAKDEPETFSGKSLAAVSSGWNVILSVFLFILPFWPIFIIAGIGFYIYKKKNMNEPNNNSIEK